MISYSQTIAWGNQSVTVSGCATRQEAGRAAVDMAVRTGWSPRRWWQFWRWCEFSFTHLEQYVEEGK